MDDLAGGEWLDERAAPGLEGRGRMLVFAIRDGGRR